MSADSLRNSALSARIGSPVPGPTLAAGNLVKLKMACSHCHLREVCLPVGLTREQITLLEQIVYTRRRLKKGETLYRAGDPFRSLYAIRSGFFKARAATPDGRDQVTGFQMAGELIGMDGISHETHTCDSIALEDSEVCVVPFNMLEDLSVQAPALGHHFHKVMSREIVREHGVMLLLGSMRAEERLAAFLLNLSQRLAARGFSATEFVLRMTREEIGSHLGLKLETVSRAFSKFQDDGMIAVKQKHVQILEMERLRKLLTNGSRSTHD